LFSQGGIGPLTLPVLLDIELGALAAGLDGTLVPE
jgi:hypothetical protein